MSKDGCVHEGVERRRIAGTLRFIRNIPYLLSMIGMVEYVK